MKNSVYAINKGVNRPVEFRGLKAQWIWWLGGGITGLLMLFAILYIAGINAFVCMGVVGITGGVLFRQVYGLSRRYGEHGLMKKMAARRLPGVLYSRSRELFMEPAGGVTRIK